MAEKIFQEKVKISLNSSLKQNHFYLRLVSPRISRTGLPGQFIEIKVADSQELLLRRPFSIHKIQSNTLGCLVKVVGLATKILAQKKPGEYLDIIGPLGHGFDFKLQEARHQPIVIVAGGMGVAPLLFLAERIKKCQGIVLIGAKNKSEILCEKEFEELGFKVKIATDDGSRGFKGKVTDLLKHLLPNVDYRLSTIYACGPRPMLQEISRLSKKYSIPAQISLEEHMACGIGACLGCAVNTKDGFKRVCKEGPVFDAHEIIWE